MNLFRLFTLSLVAAVALISASPAMAFPFPSVGADTLGPTLMVTINPNLSLSITDTGTGQGPYDSVEDTYLGVTNNAASTVSSIFLSSGSTAIFGFDSDGIESSTYLNAPNGSDSSGYGGPIGFFSGISGNSQSGTLNFLGGLAPGAQTYFSLEGPLTTTSFTPEPASLTLLGTGLLGLVGFRFRRRKQA